MKKITKCSICGQPVDENGLSVSFAESKVYYCKLHKPDFFVYEKGSFINQPLIHKA